MTDHSDYNLPRTNIYKLLPDRHKTPINKTLFENTFNRFLSKTELQHVVGSIGINSTNQLPESTPHRQAFQLQPLIHSKVATVDYLYAFRDVLNELSKLGVDISKFDSWGFTETFNFAPPVDIDKLINFSDYCWVDQDGSTPQYIVMRNNKNIAAARLFQKTKEVNQLPAFDIIAVDFNNDTFQIQGEYAYAFVEGSTFNVTGATETGNNITWTVQTAVSSNNITTITVTGDVLDPIDDVYGQIDLLSQIDPFQTEFDNESAEFETNSNMWVVDNFWIHRNDISEELKPYAVKAEFPIIEYSNTVEMNEWSKINYKWKYRQTTNDDWEDAENPPTADDIYSDIPNKVLKPSFHKKWLLVGVDSIVPTTPPTLIANEVVCSTGGVGDLLIEENELHTIYTLTNTSIHRSFVLAGTDGIRVYATSPTGRKLRVYDYVEVIDSDDDDNNFVVGVEFPTSQLGNIIDIHMGAIAEDDYNLENVSVRVKTTSSNYTANVNLMTWFKHEQVKNVGEIKYPLFNIYDINDNIVDANPIFSFKEDSDANIFPLLNKRLVLTNGHPVFKQHLSTQDNGILYYYHDETAINVDNYTGAQSIWRTSDDNTPTMYFPKLVDSNRRADGEIYYENGIQYIAVVDETNGYWEIPTQWFNNASHENKIDVSYTELVAHFLSMVKQQNVPDTFFTNQEIATRLQYTIDYGVGGTIKEHNNSFDLLYSAVFATANTPISVIEFARDQYINCLNGIKQTSLKLMLDGLLNTTDEYVTDLFASFAQAVITNYEQNDITNILFGDSQSYNGVDGIRNWIQTTPFMGLTPCVKPVILRDNKLGIFKLRHHDNHLSDIHLDQTSIRQIQKAVINTIIVASPARKRGWMPGAPADYNDIIPINDYTDIPYERLMTNDYWLDGTDFYRYEAIVSNIAPSISLPEGSYWLDSGTGQLYILESNNWNTTSPYTDAWKAVNLEEILAEVWLEVETRLYDACPDLDIKWDESYYITDIDSEQQQNDLLEVMFLTYEKERGITIPYITDYSVTDAFTWNYIDVDLTYIPFPYAVGTPSNYWGARYTTIYEKVFNTPYPHLEPWKLQGYTNKPTWWDNQYNTNPNRRWSNAMWNNIKNGKVPASKKLPNGTISTGANGQVQPYDFVCVNTTNTAQGSFEPDDLLPPYLAADHPLVDETFVRYYGYIVTAQVMQGYEFGDIGPEEWEWRNSLTYIHNKLATGFTIQPARFMHRTWGLDYVSKAYLNVDTFSKQVPSHLRTVFHGDVIDNVVYKSPGLNQWYINQNRYLNNDVKNSDFRSLWTTWVMKYSYQLDTFIDPKSVDVRTSRFIVDSPDREVIVKRTQDVDEKHIESLFVSTVGRGSYKVRNKNFIPTYSAYDWTFMIDNALTTSRTISYYGVKDYRVTLTSQTLGTFASDEAIAFETGDQISVYSSKVLPSPLRDDQYYFIIKTSPTTFKLADTYDDAMSNTSIVLTDPGQGVFNLNRSINDYFAYGGIHTAITWHNNEIDKTVIKTALFPFEVVGLQNVLNIIDGYAEYMKDQGFIFNYTEYVEKDPNTGLIMGWQTEKERLIDAIYSGKTIIGTSAETNNNVFTYTVDVEHDSIVLTDPQIIFNDGDEIYVSSTTGVTPQGLLVNRPYYIIVVSSTQGRYKLATSAVNALSGTPIYLTTAGIGTQYLHTYDLSSKTLHNTIEVNPFRNNIWLRTPTGIIANVIKGPYEEIKSQTTLYDQNGDIINNDNVYVYRLDDLTRVFVDYNLHNHQKSKTQTYYDNLHISGWKAFIDHYEHVIVMNNRLYDNTLIYDPFLGLGTPRLQVVFDVSTNTTQRPSVGGFFLNQNELVRNIEGQAQDLNNMYSVYDARESEELTQYARRIIGYEAPEYYDAIFADEKSKFIFWRSAIQHKGASNTIEAFINSNSFVDTNINEYWAYRIARFGSRNEKVFPTIKLNVSDTISETIHYDFNDASLATEQNFIPINFKDFSRWKNLPDVRKLLPAEYKTIPFDVETYSLQNENVTQNDVVVLDTFCDDIIVKTKSDKQTLVEDQHYVRLNNRLVQFISLPLDPTAELLNFQVELFTGNQLFGDPPFSLTYGQALLFVEDNLMFEGVDYSLSNDGIVTWLHDIVGNVYIVYVVDKNLSTSQYYGSDSVANILTLSDSYTTLQTVLVFINGKLMVEGVDYDLSPNLNELFWLHSINSNDQITVAIIDDSLLFVSKFGADIVANTLEVGTHEIGQMIVMVNGGLLVSGVDYTETATSIILSDVYESDDEFVCIIVSSYIVFYRDVEIYNLVPSKHKHSPLYIIDDKNKVTVSKPFLWDPARGFHNHNSYSYVSVASTDDPTRIVTHITRKANNNATYTYQYLKGDAIDINTREMKLLNPCTQTNLMLIVNGSKVRYGVEADYVLSDSTTVVWNVSYVPELSDEITAIIINNVEVSVTLQTAENMKSTETSPIEYFTNHYHKNHTAFVNDRLIFVNGHLVQFGVDYIDLDVSNFKWLNVPQQHDTEPDEIEIVDINTIFSTFTRLGSNAENGGKFQLTKLELAEQPEIILVTLNGNIVPFTYENGIVSLDFDFSETPNDEILIIYSGIITNQIVTPHQWDSIKEGTIWWDTTKLGYKLYHDTAFYVDSSKQLERWGELAEWASVDLYEWTKSFVPPNEYDNLAQQQESDASILADLRAAGTAKKSFTYDGNIIEQKDLTFDFYKVEYPEKEDFLITFNPAQELIFVDDSDVIVYVNQVEPMWMKMSQLLKIMFPDPASSPIIPSSFKDTDLIHIERSIYKVEYPRLVIDVGGDKTINDETGLVCDTTKMYSTTLVYNNKEYFISVTTGCTYEELLLALNLKVRSMVDDLDPEDPEDTALPQTIIFSLNADGNLQIEATRSSLTTSLEIRNDSLFNQLADYNSITEQQAFTITTELDDNFGETYDYLTVPRNDSTGSYNEYYFWVKDKSIIQHNRTMSLKDMKQQLIKPSTQYFLLKKYEANDNVHNDYLNKDISRYNHLVLCNMKDIITSDNRYSLVMTIDDTARDFDSYYRDNTKKRQFEEWRLFRQNSIVRIDRTLWNKLTESLMGVSLTNYLEGTITPIPTYDRVIFDEVNGTATQYGIGKDQTFGDKTQLMDTVVKFILDKDTDLVLINKVEFLEQYDLTQLNEIREFMDAIYTLFPTSIVNQIFFECLEDLLVVQPHLKDILKTSFISVHSISAFNTVGI